MLEREPAFGPPSRSAEARRRHEQTFYACDMVLYVNVNDTDWTRLCISVPPLRRAGC